MIAPLIKWVRCYFPSIDCNQLFHVCRGLGLFIGIDLVKDPATRDPNPELAATLHRRYIEMQETESAHIATI